MNTPQIDWPVLIRDFRRITGLKQEAAAATLGVSQPTLSRWEQGHIAPSMKARNVIFKTLRAERTPLATKDWVATFRKWLCPASILGSRFNIAAATEAAAKQFNLSVEALEGMCTKDLSFGEAPEVRQLGLDAGMFSGRVASVEACYHIEVNRDIVRDRSFFYHVVSWPHFDDSGEILWVNQGVFCNHREAKDVRARLGSKIQFTTVF